MPIRVGKKLSGHLLSIREDFAKSIRRKIHGDGSYKTFLLFMFVNMDETEVFFESKLNSTIHCRGDRTMSVRCSGSNKKKSNCMCLDGM